MSAVLSHLPVLTAACMMADGPILELGTGYGSTQVLHAMCWMQGKQLATVDTSPEWIGYFKHLDRPWHAFRLAHDYQYIPEYGVDWGMAFIDHGVSEERAVSVLALKHVPLIVCHDTDRQEYQYQPAFDQFRYQWVYDGERPYTTIVSDTVNIAEKFRGFCGGK